MNRQISIAIIVLMLLTNIYLVWRINANTMAIASYDAGISQRTGVGKLESFWTKYVGASKNSATTYEDRLNAESDSNFSIIALVVLDIVFIGALVYLNKKPKPVPAQTESDDDWRVERRGRGRRL
ncbi:MAG: hypothetical protein J5497_04740 [Selenomonadaceae bacterium]|nr:hypothetical protein [Selenomonadaceae bacterium]